MSTATHTTTPPGTVANACHTRVFGLAAGKCRTMQAKSKEYQRQIQNQTDNQKQTGHDANLKSMRKAGMLNFEQPKETEGLPR